MEKSDNIEADNSARCHIKNRSPREPELHARADQQVDCRKREHQHPNAVHCCVDNPIKDGSGQIVWSTHLAPLTVETRFTFPPPGAPSLFLASLPLAPFGTSDKSENGLKSYSDTSCLKGGIYGKLWCCLKNQLSRNEECRLGANLRIKGVFSLASRPYAIKDVPMDSPSSKVGM